MTMRRTMGMGLVAAGALMLMACGGSSPTRADAVAELVKVGLTQDTAECVVDDLSGQGVQPADLTGSLSADIEVAIERAVTACISTADLADIVDAREEFIQGIIQPGIIEREQAECIVASLERGGGDFVQLLLSDDFDAQLDAAIAECL